MEALTQPTLLLKPFADEGDRNSIPVTNTDASNPQRADLTNGFPAITSEDPDDMGLPPERADVNGLGYLTTTYDYFYQAGGTFTFNTTVSNAIGGYPLGARLWYTNSNGNSTILTSTKANNQDNFITTPSYIGTSWKQELPFLDGNNTWTGANTFTGYLIGQAGVRSESASSSDTRTGFFIATNKRFSLGTQPSSNITTQYVVRGNDGEWCGVLEHLYSSIGSNIMQLIARKQDKSGSATLGIGYDSNGNSFAFAPTPGITSNSTNIATTEWVNTVGNNVVHRTGDEDIYGQKFFRTGLQANTPAGLSNTTFVATTAWVRNWFSDICSGNYRQKELIFQGPSTGTNITLSSPYTDFDALLVVGSGDSTSFNCETNIITKDELNIRRADAAVYAPTWGSWNLFQGGGGLFWECNSDSTTTSFLTYNQNCQIQRIYGLKF